MTDRSAPRAGPVTVTVAPPSVEPDAGLTPDTTGTPAAAAYVKRSAVTTADVP